MSNTDREPYTEYSLLDFAAEFDGERADEHRNAMEESGESWDDPHGENSGNEPRNGVTCVACADCERLYEPKRDECPNCGGIELK